MKTIDLRLFPDVVCNNKKYSIYNKKNNVMEKSLNIPLIQAYNDLKNNQRVLVVAKASFGKSSSLRLFQAVMMQGEDPIPCNLYECRDLNREIMSVIVEKAKKRSEIKEMVYIFDAIDELDYNEKDQFVEMMSELNKTQLKIIVSSRFDHMSDSFSLGGYEFLMGYEKIEICSFTDDQIDSLIGISIDRNSGYYKLLGIPMFLSLHLSLEKNNVLDGKMYAVKKEAEFIKYYFMRLYPEDDPDAVMKCDLIHLGEYLHKQRNNRKIEYTERIPKALKYIFYYRQKIQSYSEKCEMKFLTSIHQKFLNYVYGEYLFHMIKELLAEDDEEEIVKDLSRLININSTEEVCEAFYYCGQFISLCAEYERSVIESLLQKCDIEKLNRRQNRLFVFYGANNDIDDETKRRLSITPNIDFRLFADVTCGDKVYSSYDSETKKILPGDEIPLVKAYDDLPEDKNSRVLLIAKPSMGKSTSLRIFEETMLSRKVKCSYFECKNLTVEKINGIEKLVKRNPNRLFIFNDLDLDRFDEKTKEEFYRVMDELENTEVKVVISSVNVPVWNYEKKDFFNKFTRLFITRFSQGHFKQLVEKSVSLRNGRYNWLQNPMSLSMLMGVKEVVKTEAQLIQAHFCKLYEEDRCREEREIDVLRLAEYLHKERTDVEKGEVPAIPRPLRSIFYYKKSDPSQEGSDEYFLDSTHHKYLNYIHAEYFYKRLINIAAMDNWEKSAEALADLVNVPSTYEISEALYYAGQLAANLSAKQKNAIFKVLGARTDGILKKYENVLCIFLGMNMDVAEDIEGLFQFYSPVMSDRKYGFFYPCNRIRVLKAPSLINIDFRVGGFSSLEEISVENDTYRSENNCLIRKSVNGAYDGVLLGCSSSVIPEGVKYIAKNAFCGCDDLKKVIIPSSVIHIEYLAFNNCIALEHVEIGESVIRLEQEAFHDCTAIKTLKIKNPLMEYKQGGYEFNAFEVLRNLENVVVPTQGIYYVMRFCEERIQTLGIYQGRDYRGPIKLTFDEDYGAKTGRIKNLYIYKDVEHITTEAFYKFYNELESITVEEDNPIYSSDGNCLINKKNGKNSSVILGCKNSKIPENDVKRLKGHCFVNCNGLEQFVIPDNISRIGDRIFNQCTNLQVIEIGTGVVQISNNAFRSCNNLKKVVIKDPNKWAQIKFGEAKTSSPVIKSKRLEILGADEGELILQEGLTEINMGVFRNCMNFTHVHIPSSVKRIGKGAFYECAGIKRVTADSLAPWCERIYDSISANPCNCQEGAELYIDGKKAQDIVIDSNIAKVSTYSFVNCSGLETVTFSSDSIIVEKEAFFNCTDLKTVRFEKVPCQFDKKAFSKCKVDIILVGTPEQWEGFADSLSCVRSVRYE